MRLSRMGLFLAALTLSVGALAACAPDAPPDVYRGAECAYSQQIQDMWAGTGDEHWAVDVAIRESHCNPCAYYPGQSNCDVDPRSARGIFQLLGHGDLEHAACPLHPRPWSVAECNIQAAFWLYNEGRGKHHW